VIIGVLEEDNSSEWAPLSFTIAKKNRTTRIVTYLRKVNLFLKHRMSPISFSQHSGHDLFSGRVYCHSIGLKYGLLSIKLGL
jgi:hypothetical protein